MPGPKPYDNPTPTLAGLNPGPIITQPQPYNQVLTNALRYASKDYRRLNNWADEYNGNVNYKYDQVSNLLVNLKGDGILTSSKGLGGSAQTLDIMVGNIAAWGHCSTGTEFHDVWFQSPR